MACIAPTAAVAILLRQPNIYTFSRSWKEKKKKRRRNTSGGFRAELNNGDDPLLQAAINGASLRFQETHRPEPLLLDPYAGCFITHDLHKDMNEYPLSRSSTCHYCLATKFIDDKLLSTVNLVDGLRQIVLLADGMDTRPYRLKWPNSSIIFDISPEKVFQSASQMLKGVGAKIPRSCLHVHLPSSDVTNMQQMLCRKGFSGSRPSIWALQGLPMMNLSTFQEILVLFSSLAMKGCMFVGELPVWLVEAEAALKGLEQPDMHEWMDKFFMSNGLRVNVIAFDEVARNAGRDPPPGDYRNVIFVAEQLRLSDDQMENWRREFQRVEEEGDEEGFEEP